MEKQAVITDDDLKAIVYRYVSELIHMVDIAIFKIVIDYIIRNFDPTGINIVGLMDSFHHVFIKPKVSSLIKMFQRVVNHYHVLVINRKRRSLEAVHSIKVLCYQHGCLKE